MRKIITTLAIAASAIAPMTALATSPQVQKYAVTKPMITAFNSGYKGRCSAPAVWVVCGDGSTVVALTRPSLCIVEARITTATGTNAQILKRLDRSPSKIKRARVC